MVKWVGNIYLLNSMHDWGSRNHHISNIMYFSREEKILPCGFVPGFGVLRIIGLVKIVFSDSDRRSLF